MGFAQKWGRKRMTKGAIAARERGENTYVHTLASPLEEIRSRYIAVIESEGWKLTGVKENPATPKERWTLTFRRSAGAGIDPTQPQADTASS
ncbi:hypothetical protein [Actinacidiphila bryophytorum]|uniref:Uncharacterized protein n=1 Tax=Actinacidiphila bryophytorum TaxID=1436133 RepID=A0A9W4E5M3_9ACTN|nr:hypothetical protein [Actinacidiphila bryophytorum]MBM9440929.1 hypothetical protein [Actinacidiphila bryophytorum]MBN6547642.1 hypothetical protein [Actinacidiphila bryophytorum]CAG7623898.1 conserved hypothetical protein [Actinacidiphila bryophytorum]